MDTPPLSPLTLTALQNTTTATLTTQLFRRGLRNTLMHGIQLLHGPRRRMVGTAFTLRYIPAREDIDTLSVYRDYDHPQRKAIESVRPGDVLVIDSRGRDRAASLGNILATRLDQRGCAGIVTDGSVRDSEGFGKLGLATFARSACATTNLALHHATDMQVPIGCAEVPVYPGDIIVGDSDGVVCIPRSLAEEVAAAAIEQEHLESYILSLIESGHELRGNYPAAPETLAAYRRLNDTDGTGHMPATPASN